MFSSYMLSCPLSLTTVKTALESTAFEKKGLFLLSTESFALGLMTLTNTGKLLIAKHRNTQQKGGV